MRKGDRVNFQGRTGTVVNFMPQGMVDVRFDDAGRVERRHKKLLSRDRAKRNPRPRRARKNARQQTPLDTSLWKGDGISVYTRQDPPRRGPATSDGGTGYCGNPIDGTAYYLYVDAKPTSQPRWVTWSDIDPYLPKEWRGVALIGQLGIFRETGARYVLGDTEAQDALLGYKDAFGNQVKGALLRYVEAVEKKGVSVWAQEPGIEGTAMRHRTKHTRALRMEELKKKGKKPPPPPPASAFGFIGAKGRVTFLRQKNPREFANLNRLDDFQLYGFKGIKAPDPEMLEEFYPAELGRWGMLTVAIWQGSGGRISLHVANMFILSGCVKVGLTKRSLSLQRLPQFNLFNRGDVIAIYDKAKSASPYFSWVPAQVAPTAGKPYPPCLNDEQKEVRAIYTRAASGFAQYGRALANIRSLFQGYAANPEATPYQDKPVQSMRNVASWYSSLIRWWNDYALALKSAEPEDAISATREEIIQSQANLGTTRTPVGESLHSLRGVIVTNDGMESLLKKGAMDALQKTLSHVLSQVRDPRQKDHHEALKEHAVGVKKELDFRLKSLDRLMNDAWRRGFGISKPFLAKVKEDKRLWAWWKEIGLPTRLPARPEVIGKERRSDQQWAVNLAVLHRFRPKGTEPNPYTEWDEEEKLTWRRHMYLLAFLYYNLGGYELIGPMNPTKGGQENVFFSLAQQLRDAGAEIKGGQVSFDEARLRVKVYKTYNPLLFHLTKRTWSGDFWLSKHYEIAEDLDNIGRYGAMLQVVQTLSTRTPHWDDTEDSPGIQQQLYELLVVNPKGVARHIMLRSREAEWIPWLLFYPLGDTRAETKEEAMKFVQDPQAYLRNLKHSFSRSISSIIRSKFRGQSLTSSSQEAHGAELSDTETPFFPEKKRITEGTPRGELSALDRARRVKNNLEELLVETNRALAQQGIGAQRLIPARPVRRGPSWEEGIEEEL